MSPVRIAAILTVITATSGFAQPRASVAGPVRPLPAPVARSAEALASLGGLSALSDGRVLINDQTAHRVLLLDEHLATVAVVADSTSQTNNAYGSRPGGLMAFRGDSSLFVDPASLSILVISPAGKIARIMAVPRASEAPYMTGGFNGNLSFDSRAAIIYRGTIRNPIPTAPGVASVVPESALILRLDLSSRKLDTVSFFKIAKNGMSLTRGSNGIYTTTVVISPFPLVDDWTVMSDGSIAIVRGQDYHIQFIGADGGVMHAPKIPHDWVRLTDTMKVLAISATRVALERQMAQNTTPNAPRLVAGDASDVPDYRPVFATGSVRADADNRLWIRTSVYADSGRATIHDVIDRTGKRVDRVQIPSNATIVGFGPKGAMYLGVRDSTGLHVAKVVMH